MVAAGPVETECCEVGGGAVALVLGESKLRELAVDLMHDAVTGDFGDDAGGGDREGSAVAFDDSVVRKREIFHWQPVDDAMLRSRGDGLCGPAHGEVGGAEDVEAVDFIMIRRGDGPVDVRVAGEVEVEQLALGGGNFFRVVEAGAFETVG